ncbi:hypothetical protein PIB30_072101 [Stylosanthes scabra]|uniref:Uncharacterized protein n=1 Tax=Stylosanthes scabra TaxID=79078 RepID=A0ABU6YPC2_9FABA|nr:hypothetical protein [Stylosanthes scabra]
MSGQWSGPLTTPSSLDICCNQSVVVISYGRRPCGLFYGLHSHEIVIMDDWGIQWGPSCLCPFAYISQTPTIMIDDMILGLIHSVSNVDISDPAFQGALSEINFSIIDIDNGGSFIVGTMRSNAIIGVSRVFRYTPNLDKLFGCH